MRLQHLPPGLCINGYWVFYDPRLFIILLIYNYVSIIKHCFELTTSDSKLRIVSEESGMEPCYLTGKVELVQPGSIFNIKIIIVLKKILLYS